MFYIIVLFFPVLFVFTQSIYSMEYTSKEEHTSKIRTEFYKELAHTEPYSLPLQRKSHRINLFSIFTPLDAETINSSTKTSPRSLESSDTAEHKNKISPKKKLEIIENNLTTSPHINPKKFSATMDNSDNIQRKCPSTIVSDLPELSRSRSHSSHVSNKKNHTQQKKRTVKSKSTNNTCDISKNDTYAIPKRNSKNNLIENKSDSLDNLAGPSQSNSSISFGNDIIHKATQSTSSPSLLENSTIITLPSSPRGRKEYFIPKILSNSKKPSKFSLNECNIISAIRSGNIDTIKKCIENPQVNINEQNEHHMTALHYATLEAIQSKKINIINLLLLNPQLDSTLKNNNSLTASHLIMGEDRLQEIRTILFARLTLDKHVFTEMFVMLMNLYINKQLINDKCIQERREIIKNKINKVESSQGSSELPEEAHLPHYATDEFIDKMIFHRIPRDAATTKKLIAALHQEIYMLLANKEIDNHMIFQSACKIEKVFTDATSPRKSSHKKSKEFSLPPYADYDFIFKIIQSYIQEQKKNS